MLTAEELQAIRERATLTPDGTMAAWMRYTASAPEDRAALLAHIDALTPVWRDGAPPPNTWVLREGEGNPVQTVRSASGNICYAGATWEGQFTVLWGTARWCPIRRPA